jgi:hypothetical protein
MCFRFYYSIEKQFIIRIQSLKTLFLVKNLSSPGCPSKTKPYFFKVLP